MVMFLSYLSIILLLGKEAASSPHALVELPVHTTEEYASSRALVEREQLPSWCYALDHGIALIKAVPDEYKGQVLAVGASGGISSVGSYGVCRVMRPSNTDCHDVALAVGGIVGVIGTNVAIFQNQKPNGVKTSEGQELSSRDILKQSVERNLNHSGWEFDAVDHETIRSRDEGVTAKVLVRGLRGQDNDGITHELEMRDDLTGEARLSFDSPLEKRGKGPDFTITYNFYKLDWNTKPDRNGINSLAYNLGQDWNNVMNKHTDWSNYIAALQFGPAWKMNVQIVPWNTPVFPNAPTNPRICGNAEP